MNGCLIYFQENGDDQFAALHFASYAGNLPLIRHMIALGADLFIENNSKLTSLHFAAQGDQPKILHFLLRNNNLLLTRILTFTKVTHTIIKQLYNKDARFLIDMKDTNGYTPLHWAALSGSYLAVRYLLANGASPNSVSSVESEMITPLLLAMKSMDDMREPRVIQDIYTQAQQKQ